MTTSQGLGRRRSPLCALVPWTNLFGLGALGQDTGQTMANDLYFGGLPPRPVQIPMSWLRPAAVYRQDPPIARAEVTQQGGQTAQSYNASAAVNGREWVFTETIDSIVDVDPANLAAWVTTYYDSPQPRTPGFLLVLNGRSQTELWTILGVVQGTRISVTGTSGWPDGSTELVVEGIVHEVKADLRRVLWRCAPVIGATVGTAGPWFYSDSSMTSGSDAVPF